MAQLAEEIDVSADRATVWVHATDGSTLLKTQINLPHHRIIRFSNTLHLCPFHCDIRI